MLFLAALLVFLPLVAQAAEIFTIADLSVAVVYLHRTGIARVLDEDGTMKEVWLKGPKDVAPQPRLVTNSGTGFFVNNADTMYLVTAAHVAKEMDISSKATIAGKDDVPETLSLGELCGQPVLTWVTHPVADVAVLVLKPSKATLEKYLARRFLPAGIMESASVAPPREIQLTVIGFPKGLGVSGRFSPLTLQTLSASGILTMKRFDTKTDSEFFIVQDPSTGGYSGAPLFDVSRYMMGALVTTGNGTRLYGLVHGTIADDTGGKLGAMVPSRYIIETLEMAKPK